MEKPDCDAIEGLSPAIAIEAKGTGRNPRSTVGTVTEIADYLRLLYARVGRPLCYSCGHEIAAQTVQQVVDRLTALPADTRLFVYAPVVRDRKGEHRKELDELRRGGFVRVRVDGALRELAEDIALARTIRHTIEVLVDRLIVRAGVATRLAESLAGDFRHGHGASPVEAVLAGLPAQYRFRPSTPVKDVPATVRAVVLEGSAVPEIEFEHGGRTVRRPFAGLLALCRRRQQETRSAWLREDLEGLLRDRRGTPCEGTPPRPQARFGRVRGGSIGEGGAAPNRGALAFFRRLAP